MACAVQAVTEAEPREVAEPVGGWRVLVHRKDLQAVERLLRQVKKLKKGSRVSRPSLARWAFDNIPLSWSEIKPEDVPNIGAIPYLAWAKTEGWEAIYTSMKLAARDDKEDGTGEDDGRELARLCDRLLKLGEKAKGRAGEHGA
jgi:hypothetical protein